MKICTTISSLIFKLKFSLFSSEGFCASKIQQIKSQLKRITSPPAGSVPAPRYKIKQVIRITPSAEFVVTEVLLESDGVNWYYKGIYRDMILKQGPEIEMTESAIYGSNLSYVKGKKR